MKKNRLHRIMVVRARRIARFVVGIMPIVIALLMCIHCLTLLMGKNWTLVALLCKHGVMFFILMMLLSYSYDYCLLHRLFCVYNFFVSMCIWWQNTIGFGLILNATRWIAVIFGVILFVELYEQGCNRFIHGGG